ncbi:hypothetical protein [Nitrososphaera sp. AFS]|uniref:hypothetical protein n=1 Tax=Nitrososphaera sp. AFS TaxID=2301191 RepID=UPI0013924095|nr:hypothetical protein [Nitrososphaera sp. AFS]
MMIGETQLHFISSVVILLAAAIPIYLTIKLNSELRRLTAILSIFIFIHAIYQIVSFFGFDILADGIFEPLSAAVLLFFGFTYYGQAKPKKDTSIRNMVVIWSPATLLLFMNSITIILLFASLGLFVWIAATQSKKIRSFQFQLSIFIMIWVAGDLLSVLNNDGIVLLPFLQYIGQVVHVISLLFFSVMLWLRYYYSDRSNMRIVESTNASLA